MAHIPIMVYWLILPFSCYFRNQWHNFALCPVCRDSPGKVPTALHCSLGGELCISFPLHPRSQQVGKLKSLSLRDEGGAGSGLAASGPSGSSYPHSTDSGHVSVSELASAKWGMWKLPLVSSLPPERLTVRSWWHEGWMWTSQLLRWFREVGAVGLSNHGLWMHQSVSQFIHSAMSDFVTLESQK